MAVTDSDLISALSTARNTGKRCYLNSGQSYTYTLLVTLNAVAASNGVSNVNRYALFRMSSLSEGTVSGHLRDLGRKGLLTRHNDALYVL